MSSHLLLTAWSTHPVDTHEHIQIWLEVKGNLGMWEKQYQVPHHIPRPVEHEVKTRGAESESESPGVVTMSQESESESTKLP